MFAISNSCMKIDKGISIDASSMLQWSSFISEFVTIPNVQFCAAKRIQWMQYTSPIAVDRCILFWNLIFVFRTDAPIKSAPKRHASLRLIFALISSIFRISNFKQLTLISALAQWISIEFTCFVADVVKWQLISFDLSEYRRVFKMKQTQRSNSANKSFSLQIDIIHVICTL